MSVLQISRWEVRSVGGLCCDSEYEGGWQDHFLSLLIEADNGGTANPFLQGFRSAIYEAVACTAFCFVRPALSAHRSQVELVLAWHYFVEHPVECEAARQKSDGFVLPGTVKSYLIKSFRKFSIRFALLSKNRIREAEEMYCFLSAYVHATTAATLPNYFVVEEVLGGGNICE